MPGDTYLQIYHELQKIPLDIAQQHSWNLDTGLTLSLQGRDCTYLVPVSMLARRTIPEFASSCNLLTFYSLKVTH